MRGHAVSQFHVVTLASAFVMLLAGCAGPLPEVCGEYFCTGRGYWPDTATQTENGFVAALSAIGVVSIVPAKRERPGSGDGRRIAPVPRARPTAKLSCGVIGDKHTSAHRKRSSS